MPNDIPDWTGQNKVNLVGGVSGLNLGDVGGPSLAADQVIQSGNPTPAGSPTGTGVMASFKAAAGSTIAQVGSLGAFAAVAGASITPAFGQATTSGHLLLAWVSATGSNLVTTAASGWTKVRDTQGLGGDVALFIKPNCGAGEAAPTFTSAGATRMTAVLGEFSGVATASPTDQQSTASGVGSPITYTNPAADAAFGDLVAWAALWTGVGSTTFAWSDSINNGGATTRAGDDGSTSLATHSVFALSIIPAATIAQPLGIAPWNYDAQGTSAPAVGTQASVVLAATPGKKYTAAMVTASGTQTGATGMDNIVQILDGASVIFNHGLALPATTIGVSQVALTMLGLPGTLGNSMTFRFDLGSATIRERINCGAYLR